MDAKGFTKIDNKILFDSNLSLEAIGLYIKIKHLYSIPNFVIRREYIKSISGYGETAFRRVWKELKEKGVLTEIKNRNKGKYEYTYILKNAEKSKTTVKDDKSNKTTDLNQEPVKQNELVTDNKLVSKVVEETEFTKEEAAELLDNAKCDAIKVIECYKYTISQNYVKNVFRYTKWAIKNNKLFSNIKSTGYKNSTFGNYSQRIYDFNKLERALLYGEKYNLPV